MPITERTSKIIWGQCAARCCLCRKEVLHEESGRVASLVGEVAHIIGESKKASRGDCELPADERNDPENLLLLCREHHKIVDDDPDTYPVERLHQIKADHIDWITTSLVKVQPWRSNLSQLCYINVPRLCEQSEMQGRVVDLSRYREGQTLHSLGWDLNHVMSAFQTVLAQLSINAAPVQKLVLHEGYIGAPISFDRQRFRTKNIAVDLQASAVAAPTFTGDLAVDPHIYTQVDDFRAVLFIDRRWITTTTAFTLFRPPSGQSTFSGLGRVTGVDYEARVLTITPWVIGLPKSPFEEIVFGVESSSLPIDDFTSSLDALVDLDRAEREKVYFQPPPELCDLCLKDMSNEKFMIDGAIKGSRAWACMCVECFMNRGSQIGWGKGQLYLRDQNGWLEVAGFPPEDIDPNIY